LLQQPRRSRPRSEARVRKHRKSRGQAKLFEEMTRCAELPQPLRREVVSALADLLLDVAVGDPRNRKEEDNDKSESHA
jgi:hypothetical protein